MGYEKLKYGSASAIKDNIKEKSSEVKKSESHQKQKFELDNNLSKKRS